MLIKLVFTVYRNFTFAEFITTAEEKISFCFIIKISPPRTIWYSDFVNWNGPPSNIFSQFTKVTQIDKTRQEEIWKKSSTY